MKTVIIEDEQPAIDKLQRYLIKYDPNTEITATLSNVQDAVKWLSSSQADIDLIFMDIQLTDGLAFEIFSHIKVVKPIVFTTAYDEYMLDAFKVNGVGYLLKPITFIDLQSCLNRLENLRKNWSPAILESVMIQRNQSYKDRFMVKKGSRIHTLATKEVALFLAEGRILFLYDHTGQRYMIDYTLDEITSLIDPSLFFQINRSMTISIQAIQEVLSYSSSRLRIIADSYNSKEIVVSRDRVGSFKEWLGGGNG